MSAIIEPGAGVLYMKVGTHAQESLEDIVERKSREIREAGYGMWGYGGNTCHPSTMVQPFAREFQARGGGFTSSWKRWTRSILRSRTVRRSTR